MAPSILISKAIVGSRSRAHVRLILVDEPPYHINRGRYKLRPDVVGVDDSEPTPFHDLPAGQVAQPTRFLMNQVVVKTADGWKVSSIVPIPAPQP